MLLTSLTVKELFWWEWTAFFLKIHFHVYAKSVRLSVRPSSFSVRTHVLVMDFLILLSPAEDGDIILALSLSPSFFSLFFYLWNGLKSANNGVKPQTGRRQQTVKSYEYCIFYSSCYYDVGMNFLLICLLLYDFKTNEFIYFQNQLCEL